ncbi:MAG: hypothetical protein ACREEE_10195 [Dongiaceae bacterium]
MRGFLTVLILLLIPTLLYFSYVAYVRSQSDQAGLARLPGKVPWTWLAIAGGVLVVVAFLAYSLLGLGSGRGDYHPARIIDGRIEGGYFDDQGN